MDSYSYTRAQRIIADADFLIHEFVCKSIFPVKTLVKCQKKLRDHRPSCHCTDEDADIMRRWEGGEVISQFNDGGVSGESWSFNKINQMCVMK